MIKIQTPEQVGALGALLGFLWKTKVFHHPNEHWSVPYRLQFKTIHGNTCTTTVGFDLDFTRRTNEQR